MVEQYIRACSILLQGGGDPLDLSTLRCRFKVTQHTLQTPNLATVFITNQNPTTARQLAQAQSEYKTLTIIAGYVGSSGVIFSGNIVKAIYGRENPTDTLTTILAADADQAHNYGIVNTTLAAGSTPRDHVNAAVQAMAKYGVSLGFVGSSIDLSTPVYPRAVSLFGMARDVLANVARLKGATVSYQQGKVHIAAPDDSLPGSVIVLNSQTGLIGMPTVETGGIYARALINPQLKVNGLIKIDQASIQGLLPQVGPNGEIAPQSVEGTPTMPSTAADGIYKIFRLDWEGDTRGNPWYADIGCLVPGQQTSASIAASARN